MNNQTARVLADALANLLKLEEFELYMYFFLLFFSIYEYFNEFRYDTGISNEGRDLLNNVAATLPKLSTFNLVYFD